MGPSLVPKTNKWIQMEDGHSLMQSKSIYKNILFSDGKTKLLDYISSMENDKTFKNYIQSFDINISLSSSSPLWPGSTPLHLAVMFSENPENEDKASHIVKHLLDQGALVQVQDSRSATPFHLAFRLSQQKVLSLLLRNLETKSLKVSNLLDNENLSFLHIACTTGDHRTGLARKLLSDGKTIKSTVDVIYNGTSLLHVKQSWTPLHVAVDKCEIRLIEMLLQQGADLLFKDAQGYTVIHRLFGTKSKALADALFASEQLRDCIFEKNGLSYVHVAVWFNDVDTMERLLDLGANIEAKLGDLEDKDMKKYSGCTPLHIAIMMENIKIVKSLLQRGANVLAQKPDHTSALSQALKKRRRWRDDNVTRVLLEMIWSDEKLQKHLEKELGLTVLHIACTKNTGQAEELLKNGANVNAKVHDDSHFWAGYTPLHVFVSSDSSESGAIITNLLENGCDVDQQDTSGQTALHLLFDSKKWHEISDTASLLLSTGADINIADQNGKTVLSYALEIDSPCGYGYYWQRDLDQFHNIMRDLFLYVPKMKFLGLEVSDLNKTLAASRMYKLLSLTRWDESAFYDRVQATEKIQIGHRGLTVRSFLSETGAVSRYPSLTPEQRDEVAAFHLSHIDPNLSDVLSLFRFQYRKAVARLALIVPARDALENFIYSGFPDLCVDIILKYLSNSQLKQLITAASIEEA